MAGIAPWKVGMVTGALVLWDEFWNQSAAELPAAPQEIEVPEDTSANGPSLPPPVLAGQILADIHRG